MIVDAYVTRPEVGGGNLDLVNSTYKIEGEDGIRFGQRTWRRNMVSSPFVHGEFPVTQTMGNSQVECNIQIRAASMSALNTAIASLVAAFSQFEYALYVTLDDVTWGWTCFAADIAVESSDERMAQFNTVARLSIPRLPIPISGGI